MGTEPVLVTLGPARFGVGQVRAGQAGNENLRLADDTLVDDAQRHAGVIDFERLAGAMLPAHRRRPGVSLPGMEMRAELGVAVALRTPAQIFQPQQPQCHAAATQLLLDRLPIPNPATDDPNGACQRPRTGVGQAPPRSAPPRFPSSARPPRRGRDIPSRSSARSARCATPLYRSAPAPL